MIKTETNNGRVYLIDNNKALLSVKTENVLTFDDSITIIGESFMENDQTIEGIIFSDNVEIIEKNAFLNCTNLKFVILGKSLRVIEQCAFTHNHALRYVIYRGIKDEYLKIEKGEPFDAIGIIHCTDGVVRTINCKR